MNGLLDRMLEAHRFWTTSKGDEVVSIQRKFPNCEKYGKCCKSEKSREYWEKFSRALAQYKKEHMVRQEPPNGFEEHEVHGFNKKGISNDHE